MPQESKYSNIPRQDFNLYTSRTKPSLYKFKAQNQMIQRYFSTSDISKNVCGTCHHLLLAIELYHDTGQQLECQRHSANLVSLLNEVQSRLTSNQSEILYRPSLFGRATTKLIPSVREVSTKVLDTMKQFSVFSLPLKSQPVQRPPLPRVLQL